MRIFYNKAFKNYFLLMLTLLLTEVIFRIIAQMPLLDGSMLRIVIGVNFISFLFGVINSFFGRVVGDILNFILSFIFTLYAMYQLTFYNYYGFFSSFSATSNLIKNSTSSMYASFQAINLLLLLPCIILVIFYLILEKRTHVMELNESIDFSDKFNSTERKEQNTKNEVRKKKRALLADRISIAVLVIISGALYYASLNIGFFNNELYLKKPSELFINPDMPNVAINQFGYTGYAILDLKNNIMPSGTKLTNYPYQDNYKIEEKNNPNQYTRYADSTGLIKLLSEEKNPTYKTLTNYYISQSITDKNNDTGKFRGKNLIVISMNNVNNMIINEEYFPNIYKLYNEGWSWDNAYSPSTMCGEMDSELSALTSQIPINNKCTSNDYSGNKYHTSLFELFNNYQYETTAYYNYTNKYSPRKTIYTNMGVKNYYGAEELGIPFKNTYGEWPSDIDLIEEVLEEIPIQDKFMMWISTSTTNEPYNINSETSNLYLAQFQNTNYNIELKRYLSKLKVLDEAIGTLMTGLEQEQLLDDTVIILYSTGTPNSLPKADLSSYLGYDVTKNNELDRTPFIIYNTEITDKKRNEYTSYINLTPTIANLFDLSYDPRFYMGHDLLSEKTYTNRIVFGDGSWQDEKAFYNATTNKVSYYSDINKYTDEELIKINEEIRNKFLISNLTIKTNYLKYLHDKLEEFKVSVLPTSIESETDN